MQVMGHLYAPAALVYNLIKARHDNTQYKFKFLDKIVFPPINIFGFFAV
jgi:hypothetical protein